MRVLRWLLPTLLLALTSIAFTACSFDNRRVSGHFHASVPMQTRGLLIVSEPAGGIRVETWDRPLVSIDAVEHASDEGALALMHVNVKRTLVGATVSASNSASDLFMRTGDVDLVIHAPADADLDLSTRAGMIVVRGSRASVRAHTAAGQIDVYMARVQSGQRIGLSVATGQIALYIPQRSDATVDAGAVLGSTTNDFHRTRIGSGSAQISAHVITGQVEILNVLRRGSIKRRA